MDTNSDEKFMVYNHINDDPYFVYYANQSVSKE